MEIAFSLLFGGLIGWAISHHYAKKSREELHAIFVAFARIAEERGWVEWVRDDKQRITTGRAIRMVVNDGVGVDDDANLTALPAQLSGAGTAGPPKSS